MTLAVRPSKFSKSEDSILFLGRTVDGEEMWATPDMVKTHLFVSGSTGSGKTEMLTSLVSNAMAWGSGAVFIDGKGDISFPAKLHAIATAMGREEDLLVLNFMKGAVDGGFSSHTVNPFAVLSADEMCQVMAGTLPKNYGDAMWSERAVALMNCIINTLAWLRDNLGESLTVAKIRENLVFANLVALRERIAAIDNMPTWVQEEFDFYLTTLPGFVSGKGSRQAQTVLDQHGYLAMQWTRTVGLLCTTYGHIFNVEIPEVDIRDVILNRRILVVLLPSLERSTSDIANIGALMVSMIKSMLGQALRSPVEGLWSDVVRNRITNAKFPFMVVMDEVGQYITDGMGMMAQQARSLNVGLVFATQDFDSLQSRNARETEAIVANTNSKIFMKAENPSSYHIATILRPYTDAINRDKARSIEINGAEKAVITARIMYNIPSEDGGYRQRARLDEINVTALRDAKNDPERDLAARLKGFVPGQMLVTHGTECVEGRASYIAVEDEIDSHHIRLPTFAAIPAYGRIVEDRRAAERRAAEILVELRTRTAIGAKADDAASVVFVGVSKDERFAIPPSLIDVRNVYQVWAKYLASAVYEDTNPVDLDSEFHKMRQAVSESHTATLEIAAEKTAVKHCIDFLAEIQKGHQA